MRITGSATKFIQNFFKENPLIEGIFIDIKSAGCSGFKWTLIPTEYSMKDSFKTGCIELFIYGIKLYIKPKALQYLEGSILNYEVEGLQGALSLDNSKFSKCGCGESFAV